jgi:hypothetical protein
LRIFSEPTKVKEIQSFLGFINFNRQFIEKFSEKALPLTKLTRKDTLWSWNDPQKRALQELNEAYVEPPVLVAFRNEEPMRLEIDASDFAIGACVKQERDGKRHPIAYYSRKFSGPEERHDVHDKELLAIVAALED